MNHRTNADYAAWLERLVNTCLPKELQIRIATGQPLSADEFARFASVVELVGQSKGLSDHARIITKLDNLSSGMRQSHDLEKRILSLVKDEYPEPEGKTDHRKTNDIKGSMVQIAVETILNRPDDDDRGAITNKIFKMCENIPGSYGNLKSFQRQVNRVLETYLR